MQRRTIEIGTPGTRLTVSNRQLVIDRPDQQRVTLPIDDLGVVVIDDTRASYTQSVFMELMKAQATVIITGSDHLPLGMMLPLQGHHLQTERHIAQVDCSQPVRKRIWQELVAAKIRQQGIVLKRFGGEDGGLFELSKRVRSGDPDNLEAQAAQRYWPKLFGASFRRDRDEEGINALLNYGYAVIRAAVARAIVAAGLIPSLGVFHHRRSNPFCLADDLFEPFRPFVDWRVKLLVAEGPFVDDPLNKGSRAASLSLFNEGVTVAGRRMPLLGAIETSAASLSRALTTRDRILLLPTGLLLGQNEYGEAGERS